MNDSQDGLIPQTAQDLTPAAALDLQLLALARVDAALDRDAHPTRIDPISPRSLIEARVMIDALAALAANMLRATNPGSEDEVLDALRASLIGREAQQ